MKTYFTKESKANLSKATSFLVVCGNEHFLNETQQTYS